MILVNMMEDEPVFKNGLSNTSLPQLTNGEGWGKAVRVGGRVDFIKKEEVLKTGQ